MTLLPAGACPSRRASLPTYLTPFQPSAGAQEDAGGRPFLPIESKSSRGYAYVTRFTTGVSESSGGTSRSDTNQSRLGFGEEAHQSPNPSSTMLETRSQGRGGSSGSDNSEVSVANRRRGSSTNSKGHNVNFQRVCDDELTINNQVGDLPSNVAHLIGRTKQAECVRALHIIERKSYEDEDVWPTASSREGENSSSQRSDGFDEHLWDHIMANEQQRLSRLPTTTTTTTTTTTPLSCSSDSDSTLLVRRATDPALSTAHNPVLKCVRADANEHCKRVRQG